MAVPSDIGGLQVWYKVGSLGLSDGQAVSSWSDSSGNGRTISQATGSLQPVFHTNASGLYVPGGRQIVTFDGSDDLLKTPGGTNWNTVIGTSNWTLFMLSKYSNNALATIFGDTNGEQGFYSNTTTLTASGNITLGQKASQGTPAVETYFAGVGMASRVVDNAVWVGVNNFSDAGLTSAFFDTAPTTAQIGMGAITGGQGFSIVEAFGYSSKLSETNRNNMLTYLRTYMLFGTPSTVTTGAASDITASSATLNGTLNTAGGNANYQFRWGTDPTLVSYATTTLTGANFSVNTAVSAGVSGLISGTTYYFRLAVETSAGFTLGSIQSFVATGSGSTAGNLLRL